MSGALCTCGGRFTDLEDFRDHMPCPGTHAEQDLAGVRTQLARAEARVVELEAALERAGVKVTAQSTEMDRLLAELAGRMRRVAGE